MIRKSPKHLNLEDTQKMSERKDQRNGPIKLPSMPLISGIEETTTIKPMDLKKSDLGKSLIRP